MRPFLSFEILLYDNIYVQSFAQKGFVCLDKTWLIPNILLFELPSFIIKIECLSTDILKGQNKTSDNSSWIIFSLSNPKTEGPEDRVLLLM
jgi:hypothetical protein